jgi:hypothetical protein
VHAVPIKVRKLVLPLLAVSRVHDSMKDHWVTPQHPDRSNPDWVLVLDNVEEVTLVVDVLPPNRYRS